MTLYALLCDGEIDQSNEDFDLIVIEAFDLMEMGCSVKIKKFKDEAEMYTWEEVQNKSKEEESGVPGSGLENVTKEEYEA